MKERRPSAIFLEARTIARSGREAEATDLLIRLLERHPTYWKAAKFLVVDLKAPLAGIAEQMARRALEEADRNPVARGDAARVLVNLMFFREALDLVESVGSLADPRIADAAFEIAVNMGDPALAQRALREQDWPRGSGVKKDFWRIRVAMLKGNRPALLAPFERLLKAGKSTFIAPGMALGRYADAFVAEWKTNVRGEVGNLIGNLVRSDESIESLANANVLIIAYTELGDEIRLIELVDRARVVFASCTIEVDRRIADLVARGRQGLVVSAKEKVERVGDNSVPLILRRHLGEELWKRVPSFDRVLLIRDLQALLIRKVDDLPRLPRSLHPDPGLRAMWRAELARRMPRPWIGLFWRSGRRNYRRSIKATALADWSPVFRACPGNYVNLQFGAGVSEEIAGVSSMANIVALPGLNVKDDIDSVAALMCELDLVLTIPGTTQHLAGAIGARTLAVTHPAEALFRARPGTNTGTWSPNVEVVSGPPGRGFDGAIVNAARRLKEILRDGGPPAISRG